MIDEGHQIAGHSFTHGDMTTLSAQDFLKELQGAQATLYDAVGKTITHHRNPYGRCTIDMVNTATSNGFNTIYANVYTDDTDHPDDNNASFAGYVRTIGNPNYTKRYISIQHETVSSTAHHFAEWIDYSLSQGLELVTVAECLGDKTGGYNNSPPSDNVLMLSNFRNGPNIFGIKVSGVKSLLKNFFLVTVCVLVLFG